jgi:hypothetical protein
MGYALSTDWLAQEEQPEIGAAPVRSRRRPPLPIAWQQMVGMTLLVVLAVTVAMLYIHCKDAIAQQEFHRTSLRQDIAQLNRTCVQLTLDFDRASTEPSLLNIATAQQFEIPTQIHYARVAAVSSPIQTAARPQVLASLLQRVGTAAVDPAYAEE